MNYEVAYFIKGLALQFKTFHLINDFSFIIPFIGYITIPFSSFFGHSSL